MKKNTYKKTFFYVPGFYGHYEVNYNYEVDYNYTPVRDLLCRITIEFDRNEPWNEDNEKDYIYGWNACDEDENMVKSISRKEGYNYTEYTISSIFYTERARRLTGQYDDWDNDDAGECECRHKKVGMGELDNHWKKERGHLWVQRAWGNYLEEKCKKCGITKVWDNEYETWRIE